MFSLHVRDHRLETKEIPTKEFKVTNKTEREMKQLNRFDRNKKNRDAVQKRTRGDLVNPADKLLKDRIKRMKASALSNKKQKTVVQLKTV
jgi:hypothetical protein